MGTLYVSAVEKSTKCFYCKIIINIYAIQETKQIRGKQEDLTEYVRPLVRPKKKLLINNYKIYRNQLNTFI